MTIRASKSDRGFTLVELVVSMSLGMVVMLAVFSTYAYLGRNLTRLSYRSVLESQSRKILNTIATDVRNAKSIKSATDTALTLIVFNSDPSKGTVPTMEVAYSYDAFGMYLARDPDGSGPALPVKLNYVIGDTNAQVPVTLLPPALPSPNNTIFQYSTTTGGNPASQFPVPAPSITPLSVKQVAVNFTLQAGTAAIQGQQGTLSTFQVSSGKMLLASRQMPDGT